MWSDSVWDVPARRDPARQGRQGSVRHGVARRDRFGLSVDRLGRAMRFDGVGRGATLARRDKFGRGRVWRGKAG
jgi:hypothetical protein